jgi:hypothetical protein
MTTMMARQMIAPPPDRRTRSGPLLGLLVVASLTLTSASDVPRGAPPTVPAVAERPAKPKFAPAPAEEEPKVVQVAARQRPAPVPSAVIPGTALIAYESAAKAVTCGLHWSVLAAIGRVESNHGRFGGTSVLGDGTVQPEIRGIQLDGRAGVATILDTDGGRLDGDVEYDRAIGPMQFIPSTWVRYAADGNGDGTADPHNIYDAALVAARYLCADGADLRVPEQLSAAVFRYNRSQTYVDMVLMLADQYRTTRLIADPMRGERPRPAPAVVGTPAAPPAPVPTPAEAASVSATPTPTVPSTSSTSSTSTTPTTPTTSSTPPTSSTPSTPTPPPSPTMPCLSTEDELVEPPEMPEPLLPLPLVEEVLDGLVGAVAPPEPPVAC